MITKEEAIKKAMELEARRSMLVGYSSGMTEKMFSIFSLEELLSLNERSEKQILRMEKQAAKAKKSGKEIRFVIRAEHEGFGDD